MDNLPNNNQNNNNQNQGQQQKTSVLAILALIFAFIMPIVGLILGIIALIQINKNPNIKGKGISIAAIIISVAWVLLLGLIIMIGITAYFGAFSPARYVSEFCVISAPFSCEKNFTEIISPESIKLRLNNYGVNTVTIDNVKIKNSEINNECTPSNINLVPRAYLDFTCPINTLNKGDTYKWSIEVNYKLADSDMLLSSSGSVIKNYK